MQQDWKKVKTLGEGTFGIVTLWKKSQPAEEFVAVKNFRVPSQFSRELSFVQKLKGRCKDEVERMYAIDHPNIVGTIKPSKELAEKLRQIMLTRSTDTIDAEQFPSPELPFLCMEYCSGGDLRQLLRCPENLSGLEEKEVLQMLSNISEAISFLHNTPIGGNRYIIHRDIKPENIVIQRDSHLKRSVYKLSDLGLAKDVSYDESQCSSILGTPEYIAPEIYRRIKYDKTVDFWSFGLIVYEVSCGNLPFIPGESTDRYAVVKAANNGLVTDIPTKTHLSELFRKCLTNWLPSMLQYEPVNRGKYKLLVGNREEATMCSLAWLQNLLSATFLHVFTPMKGRLVFRVRSTTTMAEVQEWICNNTGLPIEYQLILTAEGEVVRSEEMAITYAKMKPRLYLVTTAVGEQICTRIVLPKILSSFLVDDPYNGSNAFVSKELKPLWVMAIFHVQTQLKRTEYLVRVQEALRKRESRWQKRSAADIKKEKKAMQEYYLQFRDVRSSFRGIVKIQEKLDEIDAKFVGDLNCAEPLHELKSSFESLCISVEAYFQEYFAYCDNSLKLIDLNFHILKDGYNKLLREYELWRTVSSKGSYTLKNLGEVRRIISSFLTDQQSILTSLESNIKLLLHRTRKLDQRELNVQEWLRKLEGYQEEAIASRLAKQEMILQYTFPASPSNSEIVPELQPVSVETADKNCPKDEGIASPVPSPPSKPKYVQSIMSALDLGRKPSSISTSEISTRTNMATPEPEKPETPDDNDKIWASRQLQPHFLSSRASEIQSAVRDEITTVGQIFSHLLGTSKELDLC